MTNEQKKKQAGDENRVLETSGGVMPDPHHKPAEQAKNAAKAFEQPDRNARASEEQHSPERQERDQNKPHSEPKI